MAITVPIFSNFFKRKYPGFVTKEIYQAPNHFPYQMALLAGPYYGDEDYYGSLLIDLSKMEEWATHHAKATWTSVTAEQEAKEYFPRWVSVFNQYVDAITFLDKSQRGFLKPYALDFVNKGWFQIYCPNCKEFFHEIKNNDHGKDRLGSTIKWIAEWQCPNGHVLHYKKHEIRIF
ncbi:hypothetical protein ICN46_06550 [Polynucleobacter sp. Latsch14-2]|jgi:hypothetical protein|uniref:hypothetical protein n=1 Tax=Polynucleobacter sp. Latsch14-2 TaxID=2576920 RepID=UPI001BFCFA7A|nr:hypothetical protein [Polynucleobacter sp. Latsch14-2]MBT8573490.1 hypothetical protein [Polynucleobacter paneuropaeus]MBT8606764.1 hypothetical protein [Polynucleobacter paneuropaeus]MBU3614549.1 hypothetical protein [Polynucleobacter sp. Latsch14-2]